MKKKRKGGPGRPRKAPGAPVKSRLQNCITTGGGGGQQSKDTKKTPALLAEANPNATPDPDKEGLRTESHPRSFYHEETWDKPTHDTGNTTDGEHNVAESRTGNRLIDMHNLTEFNHKHLRCVECSNKQMDDIDALTTDVLADRNLPGRMLRIRELTEQLRTNNFSMLPCGERRSGPSSIICFECEAGHQAFFSTSQAKHLFTFKDGGPFGPYEPNATTAAASSAAPSSSSSSSSNADSSGRTQKRGKASVSTEELKSKHKCEETCSQNGCCISEPYGPTATGLTRKARNVNTIRIVAGGLSIGLGGKELFQFLSMLNLPVAWSWCTQTYAKDERVVGYGAERQAKLMMDYYLKEEIRLTRENYSKMKAIWDTADPATRGDPPESVECYVLGFPCCKVDGSIDGAWMKIGRDSPQGVIDLFGNLTKKIIAIAVYCAECFQCELYRKAKERWDAADINTRGDPPVQKWHDCRCNFTHNETLSLNGGIPRGRSKAGRMEVMGGVKIIKSLPSRGATIRNLTSDDDTKLSKHITVYDEQRNQMGSVCKEIAEHFVAKADVNHRNKNALSTIYVAPLYRETNPNQNTVFTTKSRGAIAKRLKARISKTTIQNREFGARVLQSKIVSCVMCLAGHHEGGTIHVKVDGFSTKEGVDHVYRQAKYITNEEIADAAHNKRNHGTKKAWVEKQRVTPLFVCDFVDGLDIVEKNRSGTLYTFKEERDDRNANVAALIAWDSEQDERDAEKNLTPIDSNTLFHLLYNHYTSVHKALSVTSTKQRSTPWTVDLEYCPCVAEHCPHKAASEQDEDPPPVKAILNWPGPVSGQLVGNRIVNHLLSQLLKSGFLNLHSLSQLAGTNHSNHNESFHLTHKLVYAKHKNKSSSVAGPHATDLAINIKNHSTGGAMIDIFEKCVGFEAGCFTKRQLYKKHTHMTKLVKSRQSKEVRAKKKTVLAFKVRYKQEGEQKEDMTFRSKSASYYGQGEGRGFGKSKDLMSIAQKEGYTKCGHCGKQYKNKSDGKPSSSYDAHVNESCNTNSTKQNSSSSSTSSTSTSSSSSSSSSTSSTTTSSSSSSSSSNSSSSTTQGAVHWGMCEECNRWRILEFAIDEDTTFKCADVSRMCIEPEDKQGNMIDWSNFTPTPSDTTSEQLYLNMEVEARYSPIGDYYPGYIHAINEDGTYCIHFLDNDVRDDCPVDEIRPMDEY